MGEQANIVQQKRNDFSNHHADTILNPKAVITDQITFAYTSTNMLKSIAETTPIFTLTNTSTTAPMSASIDFVTDPDRSPASTSTEYDADGIASHAILLLITITVF